MTDPKRRAILTALCVVLAVYVYWQYQSAPVGRWTEEVKLADGTIIKVKQRRRYKVWSQIAGPAPVVIKNAKLFVVTRGAELPGWSENLEPLLIDRDPGTGEWIIVATTDELQVFKARGEPTPPYWQFRLRAGTWREEALAAFVEGRGANLLIAIHLLRRGQHVTWREKAVWNGWNQQDCILITRVGLYGDHPPCESQRGAVR